MTPRVAALFSFVGCVALLMAGVLLLLSIMNLRSILSHGSPVSVYRPLLRMSIFSALLGIGLLTLRKWAVIMSFVPGTIVSAIFIYASLANGEYAPLPWELFNVGFVLALLGIPAFMLRYWRELRW